MPSLRNAAISLLQAIVGIGSCRPPQPNKKPAGADRSAGFCFFRIARSQSGSETCCLPLCLASTRQSFFRASAGSRWRYFPPEKVFQSRARPWITSSAARSRPSGKKHSATTRSYDISGLILADMVLPLQSWTSAHFAFAPQGWSSSGASIPASRKRTSFMMMVSPSITQHGPLRTVSRSE